MICITHNVWFHPEIESCPECIKEQESCPHRNKGPSPLFNTRRYLGMVGEHDECYDCGKLIPYNPEPE
jgi:hypothetical protein